MNPNFNTLNTAPGANLSPNHNPHYEPELIDTKTGALNVFWVNWYRSKTGSNLPDAVDAGVGRMMVLQQQMVGFFREFTINRLETLARFPDYQPFTTQGCNMAFFMDHLRREERYVPGLNEPSPFYTLEEAERSKHTYPPAGADGVPKVTPWQRWYLQETGLELKSVIEVETELKDSLRNRARITPENPNVNPPLATRSGDLSLIWLLWAHDCSTGHTLHSLHQLGLNLLGRGPNTYSGASFAGGSFMG